MDHLSNTTLDNKLTPQTMERAKRATQAYHSSAKHTIWH